MWAVAAETADSPSAKRVVIYSARGAEASNLGQKTDQIHIRTEGVDFQLVSSSSIVKKRRREIGISVRSTIVDIVRKLWPQVTSDQVTSSDQVSPSKNMFPAVLRPLWLKVWMIQDMIGIGTNLKVKSVSFGFLYRWPKVMSFSWHSHYKSMGETPSSKTLKRIMSV